MQITAWFIRSAGWLMVLVTASAARPQHPTHSQWPSAPGSFASSLSQPIPPLDGAFLFFGSGQPVGGLGISYGVGYVALPRSSNDRTPLVTPLPATRLPGPPLVAQPAAVEPWQPAVLRRPVPRWQPRGFGVLADEAGGAEPDGVDDLAPRPGIRSANAPAMTRARRFLQFGDERFRQQEFSRAYERYKKASQAAPDFADAYFRQAQAQIALGRYEAAAAAAKRGLSLQPRWAASPFRLDQLYGDNRLAKINHIELLADAAARQPDNADLMFLVGIELHFDGQPARAQLFFEQAASLGEEAGLLKGLLTDQR